MALEIESEKVKAVAKLLQRCCYAKSEIEKEKVKAVAKLLLCKKWNWERESEKLFQGCCYAKSEIWYFSTFTFLPTDKNWQSVVFESKSGKIIMQIEMD